MIGLIRPVIPDPPSGFYLKQAVLTTFDLDMDTFFNLIGPDQEPEKYIIFRGDGDFYDTSGEEDASWSLRSQVVKVAWLEQNGFPEAFFHAKVWLFEYQNASGLSQWHLIIHSANIFPYDNLETVLHFSGSDTEKAQAETEPLCDFFLSLQPFITDDVSEAQQKRIQIGTMIRHLKSVRFTPCEPPASDILQQAAFSSGQYTFFGPSCSSLPFLHETYDEMLVISPVITPERLSALAGNAAEGGRCVVLTNTDTVGRILGKSDPGVCWLVPRAQDPYVHAKLFLVRKNKNWQLYCGSMNLTDYAIDRNIEYMVRLDVTGCIRSIENFLAAFTGRDEEEITKELGQYTSEAVHFDSEVFRQASGIQTRISYLSRMIQKRKYDEEECRQVIPFLLSSHFTDALAWFLSDPDTPSIPLRNTVMVNQKARDTYILPAEEMVMLGLINHTLHQYDSLFSKNVFLHIRSRSPADLFRKIRTSPGFENLYLFRTDIHAFDPSMDADILSASIHRLFSFDPSFCSFLDRIIMRKAYRLEPDGPVFTDGPAQPTGLPLCGFLENVYLQDFDELLEKNSAFYARCGDDILIGAPTGEKIVILKEMAETAIKEKNLSLSDNKTLLLDPGEPFVFMGWSISGRNIDFSEEALKRIEKRIRAMALHLLVRYKQEGIPAALRLPSLVRYVNRAVKTSGIRSSFRIVTVPEGLRKIDRMICDAIRTAVTGKTGKGKYRLSYKTIQAWGYRSLVSQYYMQLSK